MKFGNQRTEVQNLFQNYMQTVHYPTIALMANIIKVNSVQFFINGKHATAIYAIIHLQKMKVWWQRQAEKR